MTFLRFTICDLRGRCGVARFSCVVGRTFAVLVALFLSVLRATAEQRFPPPDFESGHQLPTTTTPAARGIVLQYLDVAVLAGCLGVATWLIYGKRSRNGIVGLSLFSLAYFGFWRKGCVCAIGSLQNVSLALGDT